MAQSQSPDVYELTPPFQGSIQLGFWKKAESPKGHTIACQGWMEREALSAGHWKLNHTVKNLIIGQVNLFAQFLLFTAIRNAPGLFESFGFWEDKPAFIAFTLFSTISAPLNEVSS